MKNSRFLTQPKTNAVEGFLDRQKVTLLTQMWQILSICETETAGRLKVWLLTDDNILHSLFLEVPRRFYVNSYIAPRETETEVTLFPQNINQTTYLLSFNSSKKCYFSTSWENE